MAPFLLATLWGIGRREGCVYRDIIVSWEQLFQFLVLLVLIMALSGHRVLRLVPHVHEDFTVRRKVIFSPMVHVYKDTTVQLVPLMQLRSKQSRAIIHLQAPSSKVRVKQELTRKITTKPHVRVVPLDSFVRLQLLTLLSFVLLDHIALTAQ